MTSTFSILRTAWNFARTHSVLKPIAVWMLFAPLLGMSLLSELAALLEKEGWRGERQQIGLLILLGALVTGIVLVWGSACVLVVGGRMLRNTAGRTRTSFRAVTRQARAFVIPLILTGLLRTCFVLLWGILLIVPGIVYSLSTVFYSIVVVCEGKAYRGALRQSKAVLRGQWWRGILAYLLLCIVVFVPLWAVSMLLEIFLPTELFPLSLIGAVIDSVTGTAGILLFTLATVVLYKQLKKDAVK